MVNVVRYWFPACILNGCKGCVPPSQHKATNIPNGVIVAVRDSIGYRWDLSSFSLPAARLDITLLLMNETPSTIFTYLPSSKFRSLEDREDHFLAPHFNYVWNLQRGSSSPKNTSSPIPFSLSSRSPRSLRSFSFFMTYHKMLTTTTFPTR